MAAAARLFRVWRFSERIRPITSTSALTSVESRRGIYHGNYTTEHRTFNPKGIRQEPADEQKDYQEFVEEFGEQPPRDPGQERKFEASKNDPEEWKYIDRLMPLELVPPIPKKESYPSGFRPPIRKFGDLPYFVRRTSAHMLPVYLRVKSREQRIETVIRYVDGDLFALRKELDAFLKDRYDMEFIAQVAELFGTVKYRGDFEQDFKEFLLDKGF